MISDQMFSHYVNRAKTKIRQLILDSCQLLAGRVDKEISIFCNNCIGAFVASDFRLPFNSPTVNLMIPPADYVNYISNLEHYINADIEAIDTSLPYPVALLGNKVCLHLIHYNTLEEAKEIWRRRENRINRERMFFIFVETDGCTIKDLERFDHLPYKNKVALTHKAYPQIKCAYYIKGYENQDGVTGLYYFRKILPLRIYDQFNWMRFLKRGKI